MSNPFKAIGKAFKAVVKVVKKVAVPALIIGAVVLTGGAALGALPAIGSVLGSIGITGTMASVLGGAISSAAVGAGVGGLTAAISGKDVWSGIKGGALTGAITGGIAGGLGMISPNGILSDLGVGSQVSHLQGLADAGVATQQQLTQLASLKTSQAGLTPGAPAANLSSGPLQSVDVPASTIPNTVPDPSQVTGMGQSMSPRMTEVAQTVNSLPGDVAAQTANVAVPGAAPAGNVAVPGTVAAPGTGGGGFLNSPWAPMMAGQVISGLGSAVSAKAASKDARKEQERITASYRDIDPDSLFSLSGAQNKGLPSPAEKYGYKYDPGSGRILPA